MSSMGSSSLDTFNVLGGFPGLERFKASNLRAVGNALNFSVNVDTVKNVREISIRALTLLGSSPSKTSYLYDVYFYDLSDELIGSYYLLNQDEMITRLLSL